MEPGEFKSIRKCVEYLFEQGWKISTSSMQRHVKQGLVKPDLPSGGFSRKSILKYAGRHLKMRRTLMRLADEELQRKKTEAEVFKLNEQGKLAQIKRLSEQGRYLLREDVYLELAARTATLEAGLRHMVHSSAGDWIALVDGNDKKVGDLIRDINGALDALLNEYATKEFEVIFRANTNGNSEDS